MKGDIYVPDEVKADIAAFIEEGVVNAEETFLSAAEDEDALTGHLMSKLQTKSRRVVVQRGEINGPWSWSLTYYKFRGRGPNATERYVGADGIIELTVDWYGKPLRKTALFQTKMEGEGGGKLVEQCAKLSTWREAAFVMELREEQFRALTLDEVFVQRGDLSLAAGTPLAAFFSNSFVECEVGDTELTYDARNRRLYWRAGNKERVGVDFQAKHRLKLEVKPPTIRRSPHSHGRLIKADDLTKYRMHATPEQILSVPTQAALADPRKAYLDVVKIYHPDAWLAFPLDVRELLETRMKEVNGAYEYLKR